MNKPPDHIIDAARVAAVESTCVKSRRGVILFNQEGAIAAEGTNSPPSPFACTGSQVCRSHCGMICLHAEQRAIMRAVAHRPDYLPFLDLLHVKVEGTAVVAGGMPSCLQCSRLTVEVGLRGVWLYESTEWSDSDITELASCVCGSRATARMSKVTKQRGHVIHRATCPAMVPQSAWRYYGGLDFHIATLKTNDLRSLAGAMVQ